MKRPAPSLEGLHWLAAGPGMCVLYNSTDLALVSVGLDAAGYQCGIYRRGWFKLPEATNMEEAKPLAIVKLRMQT